MVKSVQDGVRHHAAWAVEAMPLALHLHRTTPARNGKTGSERSMWSAAIVVRGHDHRVRRRWSSVKGIIQSRHSRRSVPINLSHSELACGL